MKCFARGSEEGTGIVKDFQFPVIAEIISGRSFADNHLLEFLKPFLISRNPL